MVSLYITFLNEDIRPGYKAKIHSQSKAFWELGYESYLYIVKNYGMALYKIGEVEILEKRFHMNRERRSEERNIKDEFFLIQYFVKKLKDVVEEIKPDMVYIRRIVPMNPWVYGMIKWLRKQGIKIAYEYPTFPWKNEMLKEKQLLFYLIDIFYYQRLLKNVDVLAWMGNYTGHDRKFVELKNGIDVTGFPLHKRRERDGVALIGVAYVAYYHGYDRVIWGLKDYYQENPKRDVIFHIVGPIEEGLKLKEQVENYQLQTKVFFHGLKTGLELDKIFEQADIGVECLGLFRRDSSKTGSLKSREYMARGLPFLSCGELDFEIGESDFVYKDEPSECSIDIKKLLKNYDDMKSTPEDIRAFAQKKLSWKEQMRKVTDRFIGECT